MEAVRHREHASGAYGRNLSGIFRLPDAPTFVSRSLSSGPLAITEIRDDAPVERMSDPLPVEDAFLVTFHARTFRANKSWEQGKQAVVRDIAQGATLLRDLKRSPSVLIDQPHHSLHFYLPRAALDAICDDSNAQRIGDLSYVAGVGMDDPIIGNIAGAVMAALRTPAEANRMFLDHITLAVGTHVAQVYGGLVPGSRIVRGGLTPKQERRAKEMIAAHLDGTMSVESIASACGLSAGHFRRAFRETTGFAPHQWLLRHRIEVATARLADADFTLAEIAQQCGFADQSHFNRVFSQIEGVTPGRWRRDRDVRPGKFDP